MSTKRIILVLCYLLIMFLISPGLANAVMQLSPPLQDLLVQRGSSGSFTVNIYNDGDEDSPAAFSVHDLDMASNGRPFIADSGSADVRGFSKWVTIDTAQCVIKAHENFALKGKIVVPRNAEGGYYILVRGTFGEKTIPLKGEKADIKGSSIALQSQAMVAILLTVPSSRNKAEIFPDTMLIYPHGIQDSTGGSKHITFGGAEGWRIVMPVTNKGNIHTRVSGTLSLWTEAGTRLASSQLESGKGYVLPGKTRELVAKGNDALGDGYYMARVSLQTEQGSVMSNSFAFSVYKGETYPGKSSEKIDNLIKSSTVGFSLKEPLKQRTITNGGSSYLPISMVNSSKENKILVPRKMNWKLDEYGQLQLNNADSLQPRSANSWIEFPTEPTVLLPGQGGSCKLKINTPADIKGEYYAAIVFDSDKPNPDLPTEFLSGRTQLIALATAKGLEYKVEVDSIKLKKESTKDLSLFRFTFKIKNTGNVHCYGMGIMTLEREAAKEIYEKVGENSSFGDQQTYILPNGKRFFEVDVPNLKPGHYRVALTVTYKQDAQPVMHFQLFDIK